MNLYKMTIMQIKSWTKELSIDDYPEYINLLNKDDRKGVNKLSEVLQRKFNAYEREKQRIERLKSFERNFYKKGYKTIAGIDEAGRGPLAGPVVSCAVILPMNSNILHVDDSKKLTQSTREKLYKKIKSESLALAIGILDEKNIDRINIYEATKDSMKDAVMKLQVEPDIILIDAMKLDDIPIPNMAIVKGDSKSYSIAAASIVAKVTRDRMMDEYDLMYPEYKFKSNKGYGTREHVEAIKEYGICPIHRISFLRNILQTT